MRGVYTYEELARIENRKRTTYYLYSCGQEGQDNCQGVQGLGSLATKTCQRLGTRKLSYDAHAKPGDTGDEVRPSLSTDRMEVPNRSGIQKGWDRTDRNTQLIASVRIVNRSRPIECQDCWVR